MSGEKQPYSVKYYRGVTAKKVEWLWYPYIPYGKITIIQGDPGEGKSTVAINLASIISNGEALPLEKEKTAPTAVVYQNSEDGKEDTIVPRLIACGADLSKVAYIEENDTALELGDERLSEVLDETGARVLILDPVQAYWFFILDTSNTLRAAAAISIDPSPRYKPFPLPFVMCPIIMIAHFFCCAIRAS